jgi:DNA-binding NarL/FixJ family response regulator
MDSNARVFPSASNQRQKRPGSREDTYRSAPYRSASALVSRFLGLTPSEAEVAVALAAGKNTDDIAAERGAAKNTVRAQVQSILSKTGSRRQAELVRLLPSLPLMRPERGSGGRP